MSQSLRPPDSMRYLTGSSPCRILSDPKASAPFDSLNTPQLSRVTVMNGPSDERGDVRTQRIPPSQRIKITQSRGRGSSSR
ncbi:hypothetical protein SKAU_G00347310 [Synaphobranchus kaupii]|uniref:Uncharacterized protein n=1 Tax=Synaphobranchus kaupii TaxID=118154 RepID=A0A9Q1EJX1_SYNKA|nr:hypothetical protein SKAU_G00347310 [Synaphobranchus kaupii]